MLRRPHAFRVTEKAMRMHEQLRSSGPIQGTPACRPLLAACASCACKAALCLGLNLSGRTGGVTLADLGGELVEQWHPTKNGDLQPEAVLAGSSKRRWWLCRGCACGHPHEWQVLPPAFQECWGMPSASDHAERHCMDEAAVRCLLSDKRCVQASVAHRTRHGNGASTFLSAGLL